MQCTSSKLRAGAGLGSLALGLSFGLGAAAHAQENTEQQTQAVDQQAAGGVANVSSEKPADDEIVVTGTLLRGNAPVGSNVIAVGQEKVESTGAATSNELLASIPQVSNFFNRVPLADLAIAINQVQVSRPNIRNLALVNAASSPTLILVDGHRIASVGVRQASVDPDVIPTGALERVEVVTEGGSATYGADAVAGVINFITRRRFDGLEANARYGIADNYRQTDVNVTAGKDWGTGSAYVSYTFTKNDALYGRDRDFIRDLNYATQPYVPIGRQCDAPNVQIVTTFAGFPIPGGTVNYAWPGLGPNTFNACDTSDDRTFVPAAERHGAIAGLSQDLSDTTTIDVRAFFSRRETRSLNTLRATVNVTAANPFFIQPPGVTPPPPGLARNTSVAFSFAPLLGRNSHASTTLIEEWGVNAELKKELNDNWQVRGLFNYSRSNSELATVSANAARLSAAGRGTTAATAINPYNIAATNRALVDDIVDNGIEGQAKDELLDLRAIVDGTLLTLPGGESSWRSATSTCTTASSSGIKVTSAEERSAPFHSAGTIAASIRSSESSAFRSSATTTPPGESSRS